MFSTRQLSIAVFTWFTVFPLGTFAILATVGLLDLLAPPLIFSVPEVSDWLMWYYKYALIVIIVSNAVNFRFFFSAMALLSVRYGIWSPEFVRDMVVRTPFYFWRDITLPRNPPAP